MTEALRAEGHARLTAAEVEALVAPHADALAALAPSWNTLAQDLYLRDGGSYRARRHACFVQELAPAALVRSPHRAHWQPTTYNALHGGLERWFEP
ncbi:MAG TPA: 2OG-Fe dioxygenase family protein, partial [Steroidobacteraceae bacterium]|nr:2OG-Fe dioxygenase family protein [Steroidobacteraceae bacterium]